MRNMSGQRINDMKSTVGTRKRRKGTDGSGRGYADGMWRSILSVNSVLNTESLSPWMKYITRNHSPRAGRMILITSFPYVSRAMRGSMQSVATGGIKNETAFMQSQKWNGQVSNLHSAWKVFDKFPQQFGPLRAPLPTNILFAISLSSIEFTRLRKEKSVCKKPK